MGFRWPRPDSGRITLNGPPPSSSFSRSNLRSTIPIPAGTVASRVRSIQSLSYSTQPPPISSTRVPDGRLDNWQAAAGPRKVQLDDGSGVETGPQLFGVMKSRNDQDGMPVIPERRAAKPQNEDRSHQRPPDGRADRTRRPRERPIHASISKVRALEIPKRAKDREQVEISQGQQNNCDRTESHLTCEPVATNNPPARPYTVESESSNTTTSTMRRLSVRELFHEYGVERPAGFASPKHSSDGTDERSQPHKSHVCCHVCSFTNKYIQRDCQRCGHRFCKTCPDYSTRTHRPPPHGYMKATYKETYLDRSDMRTSLQHSFQDDQNQKVKKPDPCPVRRSKDKAVRPRGHSSQSVRNVSSTLETSVRNFESKTTQDHSSKQQSAPSRTMKNISASITKCKPAVHPVRGLLLPRESLKLRRRPGGTWDSLQVQRGSPKPYAEDISVHVFDSRAYDGDTSIQHASTCDRQSSDGGRRPPSSDEVSSGQFNRNPPFSQKNHPYFSKTHSRKSQTSKRSDLSLSRTSERHSKTQPQQSFSNDCQVVEYVECHGYPRTGHSRHSTPVESGIIGVCQHCVDDCECLACQSTPHNVRCCTHQDHPSIAHTHQTSQTVSRLTDSVRGRSAENEDRISVSSLSVLRHRADFLPTSPATMSREPKASTGAKNKRSPFQYPVTPIDAIGSNSSGSTTAIERRKNAISSEGQNTNYKVIRPRDNYLLSFEQSETSEHRIDISRKVAGIGLLSSLDTSQKQASGFSKRMKNISRESLNVQTILREEKSERLRQAKKTPGDVNHDVNSKNDALKSLKQLVVLKKEAKLHEEDKFPDRSALTNLLFNYHMGRRSKKVNRPSSPLSPKQNRETIEAPSDHSLGKRDQRDGAHSTPTHVKGSDIIARGLLNLQNGIRKEGFKSSPKSKGKEVMGITVIVHMSNKEDLFFHVDTSTAASR